MHRRPTIFLCLIRGACALALVGMLGCAHAVELGEPQLRSFIGQPLVADIELSALTADEANMLEVKVASADIYRGANVAMSPVLASLHMSIMRRDERFFLHLTSIRPVDADHFHLFLDLNAGASHVVRNVIVWLGVDPHPAPARVDLPPSALAQPPRAARPRPKAAPAIEQDKAAAQARAVCAAEDERNKELTAQIVELEAKVKTLQAAVLKPVALPAKILPAKPAKPAKAEKKAAAAFPWGWIGGAIGGLLLLAGGCLFWMKRRGMQGRHAKAGGKRSLLDRLLRRKAAPERGPEPELPPDGEAPAE